MDNFIDQRRKVVRKDFPRLAYVTGDLVVYVSERSFAHTGYLEEVDIIPLLRNFYILHISQLQQFVAASISNVVVGSMKPALILVRNKTSALDAEMDVEACTKDFATCHNCEAEMNERFSAWKCIAVPYGDLFILFFPLLLHIYLNSLSPPPQNPTKLILKSFRSR